MVDELAVVDKLRAYEPVATVSLPVRVVSPAAMLERVIISEPTLTLIVISSGHAYAAAITPLITVCASEIG